MLIVYVEWISHACWLQLVIQNSQKYVLQLIISLFWVFQHSIQCVPRLTLLGGDGGKVCTNSLGCVLKGIKISYYKASSSCSWNLWFYFAQIPEKNLAFMVENMLMKYFWSQFRQISLFRHIFIIYIWIWRILTILYQKPLNDL